MLMLSPQLLELRCCATGGARRGVQVWRDCQEILCSGP